MDWLIVLLFLVLWGIVMKAVIKPQNDNPEPYVQVLSIIGMVLIIPFMVFLLLGGNEREKK